MLDARSLAALQAALSDADVDGWLLYDFRGLNPVASSLLGMHGLVTRRIFARPLALRQVRRISRRFLGGSSRRVGATILLDVPKSVTLDAAPRLVGCTFYESILKELMQLLMGGVGSVEHVRCASRGEGTCEWRAEWRSSR